MDTLVLWLILHLPGTDVPGSSKSRPFYNEPWVSLIEALPRETHARLAHTARRNGWCPKNWASPAEFPPLVVWRELAPNQWGWVDESAPTQGFYYCLRAHYWRGWIADHVNDANNPRPN
jgi:hypothetical protein